MSSPAAPNILWIVTTQWRAQAFGYAGDPNARTPHLDALAARSINYTQAVTPHPFGPFARAALLTGVPSPENGIRDYYDPLPLETRTIAHDLNDRGYTTAFFGKWHLAQRDLNAPLVGDVHAKTFVPPEAWGGFAFWEGFESGFLLNNPWLHGTRLPEPTQFNGYQSDVLCDRAAEWLSSSFYPSRSAFPSASTSPAASAAQRPWFAIVSLEAPHPPYDAPAAGIERRPVILPANVSPSAPSEMEPGPPVPPSDHPISTAATIAQKAAHELSGYYAHVEATDRAIGRLIASVDASAAQRGEAPPVIVFTSVHGDMHGAHGLFRKGWPHEESVRVPLLVRTPTSSFADGPPNANAASPASSPASTAAVSLLDLPAMTRALANNLNWQLPAHPPSSFAPQANNNRVAISMPSVVALPYQCDRVWHGWRSPTRKEIFNADGTPWLIFDLANDPGETRNLAGS